MTLNVLDDESGKNKNLNSRRKTNILPILKVMQLNIRTTKREEIY